MADEPLIPPHGGYRKLRSFQAAQLAYDLTVRFCGRFISPRSRTHDQMVQAARSGVQNIAEGSEASATSKKMELKLTQVARASLEELRLDYEDYLRHRNLPQWPPQHPALLRYKARRCQRLEEIQAWVAEERRRGKQEAAGTNKEPQGLNRDPQGLNKDPQGPNKDLQGPNKDPQGLNKDPQGPGQDPRLPATQSLPVPEGPCPSLSPSLSPSPSLPPPGQDTLAANAALSLLNLACHLLDRQVQSLAAAFENGGGFTERLHRIRSGHRRNPPRP